jgi:Fur family ferric uptake transcriptional regulator
MKPDKNPTMSRQRRTRQQSAIEDIFARMDRPLSPQEVHEHARKDIPSLGMATVYRALNHMVDANEIRVVELPGQPPRYESAGLSHHHHFHCLTCDRVFDLDGCLLKADLNLPEGYLVVSHDITLSGTCPDCSG